MKFLLLFLLCLPAFGEVYHYSNGGGASAWGSITGTLSNQTDLQSALDAKLAASLFSDTGVTGKLLTGFSSGAGTVASTDTILQAFNKVVGNIAALSFAPTANPTFTGAIKAPVGSYTTPGLNFGDTGTGLYKYGTDSVGFTSAGTAAFYLNGSQLISTASSGTWIDFQATSNRLAFNSAGTCYHKVSGNNVLGVDAGAVYGFQDFTPVAGKGFSATEGGAAARQGANVLVGGTVTVSTTSVAATSRILVTSNVDGGTPGWLRVSSRSNGTSFTITSSSVTDTSTVAWEIFNPGN